LSEFRNVYLDVKEDRIHRDFRRMDRSLTLHNDRLVHGPYTQRYREEMLRQLLNAQQIVRQTGPEHAQDFEVISVEELDEIRRIWVVEKHEIEDAVPKIYAEVFQQPYPGGLDFDEGQTIRPEDVAVLRRVAANKDDPDELHFQLARELLHIEQSFRTASRRTGIYEALEKTLEGYAFDNEQEAYEFAVEKERMQSKGGTVQNIENSRDQSTKDLFGDAP
jgi:DNA sulfur modification protein DndC